MTPLIQLENPVDLGAVIGILEDDGIPFITRESNDIMFSGKSITTVLVSTNDFENANHLIRKRLPFLAQDTHPMEVEKVVEAKPTAADGEDFENRFNYTFERYHPAESFSEQPVSVTDSSHKPKETTVTKMADRFIKRFLIGLGISFLVYFFKQCN